MASRRRVLQGGVAGLALLAGCGASSQSYEAILYHHPDSARDMLADAAVVEQPGLVSEASVRLAGDPAGLEDDPETFTILFSDADEDAGSRTLRASTSKPGSVTVPIGISDQYTLYVGTATSSDLVARYELFITDDRGDAGGE